MKGDRTDVVGRGVWRQGVGRADWRIVGCGDVVGVRG